MPRELSQWHNDYSKYPNDWDFPGSWKKPLTPKAVAASETAASPSHKPWDQQFQTLHGFAGDDVTCECPLATSSLSFRFSASHIFSDFNMVQTFQPNKSKSTETKSALWSPRVATFLFTTATARFSVQGVLNSIEAHWKGQPSAGSSWQNRNRHLRVAEIWNISQKISGICKNLMNFIEFSTCSTSCLTLWVWLTWHYC